MKSLSSFFAVVLGTITVVLLLSCANPTEGPTVLFQEDFSAYTINDAIDAAKWVPYVDPGGSITGSTVQEARKALYLFTNRYDLYNGGFSWTDYTFSCNLKSTNISGQFGIYFRAHQGVSPGGPTYTILLIGGNRFILQSYDGATSTNLIDITTGFSYSQDQYYPLKVSVSGENIKVWFDNVQQIDTTDAGTTITSGTIGLCAWGDYAFYDDIVVTTP